MAFPTEQLALCLADLHFLNCLHLQLLDLKGLWTYLQATSENRLRLSCHHTETRGWSAAAQGQKEVSYIQNTSGNQLHNTVTVKKPGYDSCGGQRELSHNVRDARHAQEIPQLRQFLLLLQNAFHLGPDARPVETSGRSVTGWSGSKGRVKSTRRKKWLCVNMKQNC